MNKSSMLELADVIENADSDKFHMGSWFGAFEYDPQIDQHMFNDYLRPTGAIGEYFDEDLKTLKCGTTACIAGWATAIVNNFSNDTYVEESDDPIKIAQTYLGLSPIESRDLFYCDIDSVWHRHQHEYSYQVIYYYEDCGELIAESVDTEHWNVSNKEAADLLRRIANEEIVLRSVNI